MVRLLLYRRHQYEYLKQDFPRFNDRRCLIGGLRSDGIREHDAGHNGLGSRHSGNGGEFNASSADFAPATMGYVRRQSTTPQAPPTQASKPSAWKTMSISPPARPTITESAREPSMAAFWWHPDPISRGTAWLYLQVRYRQT